MRTPAWVDRARLAAFDWGVAGRDMAWALWRGRRPWSPPPWVDPEDDGDHTDCADIAIVLLPGILEPWSYVAPLARWLRRHGHRVEFVETLGWNLFDLDASAEHCLVVMRERKIRRAVLVAHSKGGLIGKAVLLKVAEGHADGETPLALGMVTVATPFTGSTMGGRRLQRLGLVGRTPLAMFLPDSPVLEELTRQSEVNARIVSLAPAWDQVIPEGSHLSGATNVTLQVPGHFRPMRDETVWRIIHEHVHTVAEGS